MDSIPSGCPGFPSWLTNVDEMKDPWCSSRFGNTDMYECEGSIYLSLNYHLQEAEGKSNAVILENHHSTQTKAALVTNYFRRIQIKHAFITSIIILLQYTLIPEIMARLSE